MCVCEWLILQINIRFSLFMCACVRVCVCVFVCVCACMHVCVHESVSVCVMALNY